jgi:hypothetical protein
MTLWEAAGTYPSVCASLAAGIRTPEVPEGTKSCAAATLDLLRHAHIVSCPKAQVEALPSVEADMEQYARHLRPPFGITYLSLEGARMAEVERGARDRWEPEPESWTATAYEPAPASVSLAGVVLAEAAAARAVWRIGEGEALPLQAAQWLAIPILDVPGAMPSLSTWLCMSEDAPSRVVLDRGVEESTRDPEQSSRIRRGVYEEVERAIAVLVLLDKTVGVELREKDRREVSRQVMRHAERKGAKIAWTVAIEAPKRSSRTNGNGGGKANYSHRFERAASFACVTKGAHVRDAEKLSTWCPRHGVKACRREFRGATIVGPAHLPLIPKVRQITEAHA